MKKLKAFVLVFLFFTSTIFFAQQKEAFIDNVIKETYENSQLEQLGYELLDEIGPRLVGSTKMKTAHDWAVTKFNQLNSSRLCLEVREESLKT
ncbi:MAG: hypothetical protein RQ864_06610 [Lutibacter sp.]|nr:hypothetical protein [Lutibacter sp.]